MAQLNLQARLLVMVAAGIRLIILSVLIPPANDRRVSEQIRKKMVNVLEFKVCHLKLVMINSFNSYID